MDSENNVPLDRFGLVVALVPILLVVIFICYGFVSGAFAEADQKYKEDIQGK